MEHDNSRNTIMFVICAVAMLILYQIFVLQPAEQRRQVEAARAKAAATQAAPGAIPGAPATAAGQAFISRAEAAAATPRVPIDTPALRGSVNLRGGRLDDLFLKDYRQSVARDAPPVELFRPEGARQAYFADVGWTGIPGAPGAATVWTQVSGGQLTPNQPVVLRYDNGQGLVFTRTISVDQRYMFTIADTVANRGAAPVQLAPYASVQRQGLPADLSNSGIIHEGAVGVLGQRLKLIKFKPWREKGGQTASSTGGWVGVTDKYWLAAVIPQPTDTINGQFRVSGVNGVDVYEANYVAAARTLAPGMQTTETTRVFAGAKKASILQDYEKSLGVAQLDQAIDWGNFWFFTRPIFMVLSFYQKLVLNFGIAILLLTVTVKVFFFPLANKSYESISKMKKLQPQMEELKKRHEKDPQKQQQEIMALYQREKINPLMGCLPILVQIPVFYALYKVLSVTIEMRHQPFFGWIRDLSAPDPTNIWNLFGALPYDPAAVPLIGSFLGGAMHIGVWPLIMGFTMWLQQAMSPPPSTDPSQKIVFQFLPIIFTFTMAHFAAGLVIYWSWNNFLSIVQQYVIMRRFKVENPIDDMIGRFRGKPAQAAKPTKS